MYELFQSLCLNKGVTPNQVAKAIGVSASTLSDWKRGSKLRPDKIKKIAEYFDVSVEYLSTGREENDIPIPENEDAVDAALIAMLQALPADKVQRVKDFVAGMLA